MTDTADVRIVRPAACTGTGDADCRAVNAAAMGLLDTLLPYALSYGPATTTELRDRLGCTRPYLSTAWGVCDHVYPECHGHPMPDTVYPGGERTTSTGLISIAWTVDLLRRWLLKAEQRDQVSRVVFPGQQKHLWAWRDG